MLPVIVLIILVASFVYFTAMRQELQLKEDIENRPRSRYKRFVAGVDYPKTLRTSISEKYHITTNIALEKLIRIEAASETKKDWVVMFYEYPDKHLLAEKIFEYCETFIFVDKNGKALGQQVHRIEEALKDVTVLMNLPLKDTEKKTDEVSLPTAEAYLQYLFLATVSGKTRMELQTYRVYSISQDGVHDSYDQEHAKKESKRHLFPKLWLILHRMNLV